MEHGIPHLCLEYLHCDAELEHLLLVPRADQHEDVVLLDETLHDRDLFGTDDERESVAGKDEGVGVNREHGDDFAVVVESVALDAVQFTQILREKKVYKSFLDYIRFTLCSVGRSRSNWPVLGGGSSSKVK